MIYINEETLDMCFGMINFTDNKVMDGWFECDDLIAESIIMLNKKGYKTLCCCQGHIATSVEYWDDEVNEFFISPGIVIITPYIWFDHEFKLDNLPDGWDVSIEDERTCIRYDKLLTKYDIPEIYDGLTLEFYKDILDISKDLYYWVKKLPYINGGVKNESN